MGRSERILIAGATLAAFLVACQAVIGLDKFQKEKDGCAFMNCDVPDAPDDVMMGMDAPDYFGDGSAAHRWVAWPMPNPADAETDANIVSYGVPFEAGIDGGKIMVVRDLVTNLEWMVAAGPAGLTFPEALAWCDGLGNNFRLPTRIELASLWDYTRSSPAFDTSVFTGVGAVYWTQSPGLPDKTTAWVVDFGQGNLLKISVGQQALVRCVR